MKILYLHQYFLTPEQGGAIRSYHLAKALVDAGHDGFERFPSHGLFGHLAHARLAFECLLADDGGG